MANEKSQEMEKLSSQICNQISSVFSKTTDPYPPPLDLLVTELAGVSRRKSRVFLHGVGREGLMLKAFAMRLFHLGLSSHLVSDVTTPPISSSDLLIASAGPGGFSTVDAICSVAKSSGAKVLLLTAQPETGSCVKHATAVCYVPAQTMASDGGGGGNATAKEERELLPMGSVYEGALFVLFEMVVYKLGEVLGESPESVRSRHTNLE
uniref:SIS domain-containing protein n=1 Tax=Noccaea caerulescens TaxID=107243 RepID=A0A1J3DFT5_NOCCA